MKVICRLFNVVGGFFRLHTLPDYVEHINHKLNKIMSAVSDFAAKVQVDYDKVNASLDAISGDITALNDAIQALQNSQGQLGPADQAALDDIASKSSALAAKADALDQVVPPPTPAP